jgi:tRNA (cmo5U34)-methyltransferase
MMSKASVDTIFAKSCHKVEDFEFNAQVAQVFPDMIQRSVPGYLQIIDSMGDIAAKVVQPQTNVYDLGCSLGAVSISMRQRLESFDCQMLAVDNSEAMLKQARLCVQKFKSSKPIEMMCQNIEDTLIHNASLVVLNFTLQFIAPEQRQALIDKIYQGLVPGGALIVSEKLRFAENDIHALLDDLHINFKRANGYSDLEISQKRTAIENVMKPDTLEMHEQRFQAAGFTQAKTWFQCFNFASMVAIK